MARPVPNPEASPSNHNPRLLLLIAIVVIAAFVAFIMLRPKPTGPRLNSAPTSTTVPLASPQ